MAQPTHPVRDDIGIMDPHFHQDPFERYRWMRDHAPVYWDPGAATWDGTGAWGVTRYKDIRSVHGDQQTYSSAGGSRPDAPPVPSMINRDEPEHLARRAVNRLRFTPTAVARYEEYVRATIIQLIEGVLAQGQCDLVSDLAKPLPMMVIGRMLGVPDADYEKLLEWSDLIATGLSNMPAGFEQRVFAAAEEFRVYINGWFEKKTANPAKDILTAIVQAKVLGRPLGEKDRIHEALLLLVGGDETTRHVISGGLAVLLQHPEQFHALREDPARIPTAVEEMLRIVTPVKTIARQVTADCELGGQRLKSGDKVILLFESGNRDERKFPDPDRFDSARSPNRHLSFGGYGRHHCLGAHLARLEIRVMLEEILIRMPTLRLASNAAPPKRFGTFVLGLEALPIKY